MQPGRRATLAVLALLLGLLSPLHPGTGGTTSAQLSAHLTDATPTARPAPRPHVEVASTPDALTPTDSTVPPRRSGAPDVPPVLSAPSLTARSTPSRGPPQV